MQRIAVIGLGRFGMTLARQLESQHVEVVAIDNDPRLVEEVKDDVTLAVCMDATDDEALASHEVPDAHVCVVAIGENFEASLLTATALKRMGAKKVIVRAQSATHAEIFRRLGADEIIQPETEAGQELARRLSHPRLQDLIELSGGYMLFEIKAPAAFHGKSLEQLALRNKYGVNLVAIKRRDEKEPVPPDGEPKRFTHVPQAGSLIEPDDLLLLLGTEAALGSLPR